MPDRPGIFRIGSLLARFRRYFQESSVVFYQAPADSEAPAATEGFGFAPVAPERLDVDPIFAGRGRRERFYRRLRGDHALLGWHDGDGRVVSYIWFSRALTGSLPVPFRYGMNLLLRPGQAYVWDCATDDASQGQGFYRKALKRARHVAYTDGCSEVYICTDVGNLASTKGILAAGFAERVRLRVSRFGPIRRIAMRHRPTVWFLGASKPCPVLELMQDRAAG